MGPERWVATGTITGAVNVSASGATINPGATAGAIGTLNTGALTLSNSSKFSVDMLSGSGNADQISVTGGGEYYVGIAPA